MQSEVKASSAVPMSLKVAIALFVIHVALYSIGIVQVLAAGEGIRPNWIIHPLVCLYLASRIARAKKGTFYLLAAYPFLISALMLRANYVAAAATGDAFSSMAHPIAVCVPLLAAGVALVLGRRHYLGPADA